jgi:hypothetical protein
MHGRQWTKTMLTGMNEKYVRLYMQKSFKIIM